MNSQAAAKIQRGDVWSDRARRWSARGQSASRRRRRRMTAHVALVFALGTALGVVGLLAGWAVYDAVHAAGWLSQVLGAVR